ncbi:MAG: VPLPA-CTERM sorting domain-containing protein [Gammaproteobacteria bacterium]|nr:VPLPA-CTERM sorting domain-containing protein [Gammaproteobacteria bacterium]
MKNIKKIIAVASLIFSSHLSAASISWSSATTSVNINDTFTINVTGSDFVNNVDGGGINIIYNASVLNVLSVSIDESIWDLGAGIRTGTIDNLLGSVDGISVNAWSDVTGNFSVASVTFQAIGSGNSLLSLSEFGLNPWASGGSLINPDFIAASVDVSPVIPTPVPAAVWLLGSGLVALTGFARRKAS